MTKRKDKLQTRIQQLQNQLKDIERREKAQTRKQETKKKILIGAMIQKWIEQGRFSEINLMRGLDIFLVRDSERSLFELPPKKQNVPKGQDSIQNSGHASTAQKKTEVSPAPKSSIATAPAQSDVVMKAMHPELREKQKTPDSENRLKEVDEKKLAEEFL